MNNLKIAQVRVSIGMSQTELARRIGVSQNAVSKWERGVVRPPVDALRQLAELAGVDINYLISDGIEPVVPKNQTAPGRCESCAMLEEQVRQLRDLVETQKELIALLRK